MLLEHRSILVVHERPVEGYERRVRVAGIGRESLFDVARVFTNRRRQIFNNHARGDVVASRPLRHVVPVDEHDLNSIQVW